jgi:thioredoxin reductase (NADPH)
LVYLVHRRDKLRAEKILQDRLFSNDKIECIWNSQLADITGDADPLNVTGVKLQSTVDGSITEMKIDGVFVAIGHDPATGIFKGQVEMDNENYIITKPDSTLTSVDGVYAAGDVKDKTYRQAVTAAGMGCMAALEAEKYLSEHEAK